MYIQKDDLVIRDAATSDAEILCSWWNDGAVMAHAGYPNGLGTTTEKIRTQLENGGNNHRLIIEEAGLRIGEMSYRAIEDKTAEIGIKICVASGQNRGLGTKLLNMLIESLFNNEGFDKISLDTNVKNTRAQHVYEKIGFKKIRVNIDAWKDQLGETQSSVDYTLSKDEYIR